MVGRKLAMAAAVGLGLFSLVNRAEAASVTDVLQGWITANSGNPISVSFEDDDRTLAVVDTGITGGPDGLLGVGDVLRGYFDMTELQRNVPASALVNLGLGGVPELTGIYELKVTSKSGSPSQGFTWNFGPSAAFETLYGIGAMIAIYEDATPDGDLTSPATAIATATNDGSLFGVLGFKGVGFESWTTSSVLIAGSHQDSFAAVAVLSPNDSFANGSMNLNRVVAVGGPTTVDGYVIDPNANLVDFGGTLSLRGGLGTNFPITSKASLQAELISVPVPSAMWGGMVVLAGLGAVRIRRILAK